MTDLYLTRIRINLRDRTARDELDDAVRLHRRIMSLFPDDLGTQPRRTAGVLFRREEAANGPALLVQSTLPPDLGRLPLDYGQAATKDISRMLDALRPGLVVRYRVAANASRKLGPNTTEKDAKPRQVIPLTGADAETWWRERAADHGLGLHTLLATPQPKATGRRSDRHQVHHAVTCFDGSATITDAAAVRALVLHGLGRGKSYGCGLVSLAPARSRA